MGKRQKRKSDDETYESRPRIEIYGNASQKDMVKKLANTIGLSVSQTFWEGIDAFLNHEKDGRLADLKRRAMAAKDVRDAKAEETLSGDYYGSFDKFLGKLFRIDEAYDEKRTGKKTYIYSILNSYNSYEMSQAAHELELFHKFDDVPKFKNYTTFYRIRAKCPECGRTFFRVRREADKEHIMCTKCSKRILVGKTVDYVFENLYIIKTAELDYDIPEKMRKWEEEYVEEVHRLEELGYA
jgi:DNA-directed RNA polymerase subunit RPC12/RpoP